MIPKKELLWGLWVNLRLQEMRCAGKLGADAAQGPFSAAPGGLRLYGLGGSGVSGLRGFGV